MDVDGAVCDLGRGVEWRENNNNKLLKIDQLTSIFNRRHICKKNYLQSVCEIIQKNKNNTRSEVSVSGGAKSRFSGHRSHSLAMA